MSTFDYIRNYYRVPARFLGRVRVEGKGEGTMTKATHYVWIRLDDEKHAKPYHPKDECITYLEER